MVYLDYITFPTAEEEFDFLRNMKGSLKGDGKGCLYRRL